MRPRTLLIATDTHVAPKESKEGGIDARAESVLMQAIDVVRPDEFVLLGDVGEWESVNPHRWNRRKWPEFEYLEPMLRADVAAVNGWLDRLEKKLDRAKCGKVTVLEGNHEVWLDTFAEAQTRGEFAAKEVMRIKERGWEWWEYGKYVRFGKLYATHGGHFKGLHHAYKTVKGLGACCVYGHHHSVEFARTTQLGGTHGAWCLGCLCKIDKKFLAGMPTNWSHALAVVHVERDGTFRVEVVDIFEGVAWVYGHRVEAKL